MGLGIKEEDGGGGTFFVEKSFRSILLGNPEKWHVTLAKNKIRAQQGSHREKIKRRLPPRKRNVQTKRAILIKSSPRAKVRQGR